VEWPKAGFKELIPDHRLVFAKVIREQIDGYFYTEWQVISIGLPSSVRDIY